MDSRSLPSGSVPSSPRSDYCTVNRKPTLPDVVEVFDTVGVSPDLWFSFETLKGHFIRFLPSRSTRLRVLFGVDTAIVITAENGSGSSERSRTSGCANTPKRRWMGLRGDLVVGVPRGVTHKGREISSFSFLFSILRFSNCKSFISKKFRLKRLRGTTEGDQVVLTGPVCLRSVEP